MSEPENQDDLEDNDSGDCAIQIPAKSLIDHTCVLSDQKHNKKHKRMTTIICTIGHVSRKPLIIEKMIGAGMNVALLNMANGNHSYHAEDIVNIGKAVEFYNKKHVIGYPLAIIMDLVGPEIRTGSLKGKVTELEVKKGDEIVLTTNTAYVNKGTVEHFFVDYHNIVKVVKMGDTILLDKGYYVEHIALHVVSVGKDTVHCVVECGGMIINNMLIHLPGLNVDLPPVSQKDTDDIKFGLDHGVDLICASFIRSGVAVNEIRNLMGERAKNVLLISKIETMQGMLHLDEIIEASDGIMVVRGKLSIEMPAEKVFAAQRIIIAKCNKLGKPVIVATQLLESTITKVRPTRSEVTDVANAIISGASCVMLTSETAIGENPIESISTMASICKEAETAMWHTQLFSELVATARVPMDAVQVVAIAAVQTSFKCMASAIIVVTTDGRAARLVSRYRPRCPIISVTRNMKVARQNQLYRGIMSVCYKEETLPDWLKDVDNRIHFGLMLGQNRNFINFGDPVVIIHGWKEGTGFMNTMRVMHAAEAKDLSLLHSSVNQFGFA